MFITYPDLSQRNRNSIWTIKKINTTLVPHTLKPSYHCHNPVLLHKSPLLQVCYNMNWSTTNKAEYTLNTDKYLSEALIFASTNPQYDDRFVHWIIGSIHENSKLKPGENMLYTEIVSDIHNNFCTQHVLPMFCKKKSFWQRFTCICAE